jgi:ectoine hydroxylase-related dioxygenase (phytanoyl-CoA dioxygenase family)
MVARYNARDGPVCVLRGGPRIRGFPGVGIDAVIEDGISVLPELHQFEVRVVSGRVVRGGQFKIKEPALTDGAERFLPIVEEYYGKPVSRISAELVSSWPVENPPTGSQLWHRDTEGGDKQVRAMCYLTDVTLDDGPLCYVPGSIHNKRDFGRYTDKQFEKLYPRELWKFCTGPKGTVILFDTMGFHKGLTNLKGRREALVFTYHAR